MRSDAFTQWRFTMDPRDRKFNQVKMGDEWVGRHIPDFLYQRMTFENEHFGK